MGKLLTVVVPTYNIEKYIEKCIRSFQDVENKYKPLYEVLIVNDGSTDDSVKIAEETINDDLFLDIKIINKENGGHGSAVNKGIDFAQGKYFKVIDGDDWVNSVDFQRYLDTLNSVEADMIITDYTVQKVYNNTTEYIKGIESIELGIVFEGIPSKRVNMHAITYRTNILKDNNIRLSEKSFYVDIQYILFPLKYVEKYVYYNLDVYQYLLGRPDQSMNIENMKKNVRHHLLVTKSILNFYDRIENDVQLEKVVSEILNSLINTQVFISLLLPNTDELLDELFNYLLTSDFEYKFNKTQKRTYLEYVNYRSDWIFSKVIRAITKRQAARQSQIK